MLTNKDNTTTIAETTTALPKPSAASKSGIGESKEFKIPTGDRPKRHTSDSKDGKKPFRKPGERRFKNQFESEYEEKVVQISRVTNVTKGGRRFSFSAYVVIGNKKGKVGIGHGKANEVPDAIKKAIINAKKHLVNVPIIDGRTVPHDQTSKYLASRVMIKPAPKGKGIIAGGAVRAIVELAGYKDIYTKSFGSRSKANTMKAALKALLDSRKPEQIAEIRNLSSVKDLFKA